MFTIEITKTGPRRLAGLTHQGAYYRIGETMALLRPVMAGKTAAATIAAYYDDPGTTAEADLRSFAGVGIGWKSPLPEGCTELRLAGGRCAELYHTGPYDTIPAAWQQLKDWVQASGEAFTAAPAYEVYRSMTPGDFRTDIYWPLA